MPTAPTQSTIWRPHVTAACVIVERGRFLMVEERIRGELCLNQPAGHLEDHETLAAAARRETLEETGWDVGLDHFIGVQQWHSPVHDHDVVRFAFAGHPLRHHPERGLDAGITQAPWLTYAEVLARRAQFRSPLVLTTLDDWLAGQRLPLSTLRSLLPGAAA